MKRYYAAAGALLLGTSALAWAGSPDKVSVEPVATTDAKTEISLAKTTVSKDAKFELASLDKDLAKLAVAETDHKVQTASVTDDKIETAAVDKVDTGMGGPLEEADAATAMDLTPRPAAQNYPPCSPGPGDDRCIQLYEPGVRAQLASWDRPTGGLADGSVTTAMGGPFEPVETTSAVPVEGSTELGMSGDGTIDASLGETAESETAAATSATTIASHSDYQGVGGPVEAQSGYPPCDPGPGDDRCIQLYEPGVTGAGN